MRLVRRSWMTCLLASLVVLASLAGGTVLARPGSLVEGGVGFATADSGRIVGATVASMVLAVGVPAVVSAVGLILLLVGPAERLMGPWRTLAAFVVTGAVGVWGGIAVDALGLVLGRRWDERLAETPILDPLTAVTGTILTASAFADQLWRRRIRVIGLGVLVVLALYVGGPESVGRFVAGLTGLVVGVLATRARRDPFRIPPSSHHESRLLLASLTALLAAGPLLTLVTGHPQGPVHLAGVVLRGGRSAGLEACIDGVATAACRVTVAAERMSAPGPYLLALLPVVLLALSAWALSRGRRAGVWAGAAVLFASGTLSALTSMLLPVLADPARLARQNAQTPPTPGETLLAVLAPVALAAALIASRRIFPVRSTARARKVFVLVVAASLAVATMVSAIVWRLSRAGGAGEFWGWFVGRFVPAGYLGQVVPSTPASPGLGELGSWLGPAVGLAVVSVTVFLIIDTPTREGTPDRERFRRLLRHGSSGAIAHMALWPGNSYWFAPGVRAGVAYRVVGDVALTIGGPVMGSDGTCDEEGVIRGFADLCETRGWIPAFYSVEGTSAGSFERLGWSHAAVGEDALIDPSSFSLVGGRWKDIRTSINRARKAGVEARWEGWNELGHGERNQVRIVSEDWVAGRPLPEMGFTLGGVDELADPDVRLMLAVAADGTVLAVTSWLPTWRDGRIVGWTLDLMRRRTESMNGVMEFLIAEAIFRARDDDIDFVSLSAAPLAGVGRAGPDAGDDSRAYGPGMAEHMLGYLGRRMESLYGFQSLLSFKQKFGPELRPLIVAYPDPLALPAVVVALTRSYLPSMSLQQCMALLHAVLRGLVGAGVARDSAVARRTSP